MKKGLLFTLYSNFNYGNKLQNYATYEFFKKMNIELVTIKNNRHLNYDRNIFYSYLKYYLSSLKYKLKDSKVNKKIRKKREESFKDFNKFIPYTDEFFDYSKIKKFDKFDYYVVGSDQVWNPYMELSDLSMFKGFKNGKKVAFASSVAVSDIPEKDHVRIKNNLKEFEIIRVREIKTKELLSEITNREDIEVILDPTMYLNNEEWEKVSKKPENYDGKKFILNYFLGELDDDRKMKIDNYAKENNLNIINLLDPKDPYYTCGPSEFLWLEKNAEMICTDSFHSCVFAILNNRPFYVFDRLGSKKSMNSRIDTLLELFDLKNRKFSGSIDSTGIDYEKVNTVLENERAKTLEYFNKKV